MAERKKKNPAETKKPKKEKVLTYGEIIKKCSDSVKKSCLKEWKEKGIKLTDEYPIYLWRDKK